MTLLLLALGCFNVPGLGGQAGEEITDTATVDGDSANEGGNDTSDPEDDGLLLDLGDHEGTVFVEFSDSSGVIGSCTGTAELDVDPDGEVDGSASCAGDEDLDLSIGGTLEGGTILASTGTWTWVGSLEDDTFVGTWTGPDLDGVTHDGRFEFSAD